MSENKKSDLEAIINGNYSRLNMSNKETKDSVFDKLLKLFKDNDELDTRLAIILTILKMLELFENKDIIPRNFAKGYALLSETNQVQKDLINAIISKSNDKKGQTKKMILNLMYKTLEALKQNQDIEKESLLSKLGIKR